MAITVDVKPNLDAFRSATIPEIMEMAQCDRITAEMFAAYFWCIPR